MSETDQLKESLQTVAANNIKDLIYTVAYDIHNELIAAGINEEKVSQCITSTINKYVDGGLKLRKKPAPRATKVAHTPTDAITAAARKTNKKVSDNFLWIVHPSDNQYVYTTSAKLARGYPVKDTTTNQIVGTIDEESSHGLSKDDARVALSLGLAVDFSRVVINGE